MEFFGDLCRLCLDHSTDASNASIEDSAIRRKIDVVFSFTISIENELPTEICEMCCKQINEFYTFTEKVRSNQEKLQERKATLSSNAEQAEIDETFFVKLEPLSDGEDNLVEQCSENLKHEKAIDKPEEIQRAVLGKPLKKDRKRKTPKTEPCRETGKAGKSSNRLVVSKEQEKELLENVFPLKCDLCDHVADDFIALKRHFRETHDVKAYVTCCSRKFSKRVDLLDHMVLHVNPNAYLCTQCNKHYNTRKYLLIHQIKAHGKDEDRPFRCDRCSRSFSKSHELRHHLVLHNKAQCPHCDRVLSNRNTLKIHIANIHRNPDEASDRVMVCDICGKEFLNKQNFNQHLKQHQGQQVTPKLQCDQCQKWFKDKGTLKKHEQFTHRERGQTFTCDVCHQNYVNSKDLAMHKKRVHVDEKYACEFCERKFKRPEVLREHRTTHTGEVLYSCEHCGVPMNSKANLYRHVKKNHQLEWAEKRRKQEEANVSTV